MEVRLAIRMSCALPIIFTPVTFEGKMYIDGCCYKAVHVPTHVESKLKRGTPGKKNIILRIKNIMNIPDTEYGDDFISFIIRVANSFALFAYREMDNSLSHDADESTTILVDLNMEPGFCLEDIVTFDRDDVESLIYFFSFVSFSFVSFRFAFFTFVFFGFVFSRFVVFMFVVFFYDYFVLNRLRTCYFFVIAFFFLVVSTICFFIVCLCKKSLEGS
eukprot:gene17273-biopygen26185